MSMLQKHIQKLVEQHGSLRAAARVLEVDPGYLSRLHSGEKDEPGEMLLHRLRLRRVVTYEPVKPMRVSRTRGVYPAAPTVCATCNGTEEIAGREIAPGVWETQRCLACAMTQPSSQEPISTEFHTLQRIRAAIAADCCAGESEYADGVNAACQNHLALIDRALAAPEQQEQSK